MGVGLEDVGQVEDVGFSLWKMFVCIRGRQMFVYVVLRRLKT